MRRRIVITGIGFISPHGHHAEAVFNCLMKGKSALRMYEQSTIPIVAGMVDFDASQWFEKSQLLGLDRVSQFAVAAADLCKKDAGLEGNYDPDMSGVFMGCGMGGAATLDETYQAKQRGKKFSPLSVVGFMPNAPAANIAIRERISGPVMTYSVACASSAIAIAESAKAIAMGEIDVAFAGGTESLIYPHFVEAWLAMRTLAKVDALNPAWSCKPFGVSRSGFVLSEGAAVLCLEELSHAQARGAKIYAELAGSASYCDAHHLVKPCEDGQIKTLKKALSNAGLEASDIVYCNAHGTGTQVGDAAEAKAIQAVWGEGLSSLKVGSTKSMHGHLLGAAGALEAGITALSVYKNQIPAHVLMDQPDANCGMPLVGQQGERDACVTAAISNSFAFGGTNCSLVFKQYT